MYVTMFNVWMKYNQINVTIIGPMNQRYFGKFCVSDKPFYLLLVSISSVRVGYDSTRTIVTVQTAVFELLKFNS